MKFRPETRRGFNLRAGAKGTHGRGAARPWRRDGSRERHGGQRSLRLNFVDTFLLVSLEDIPSFELAVANIARIRGLNSALVPLVANQSGLVLVAATATVAAIFVGGKISFGGGIRRT